MKIWEEDLYRIHGRIGRKEYLREIRHFPYLYLYAWRKVTSGSKLSLLYRAIVKFFRNQRGLDLPYTAKIGGGLLLVHAFGITLNDAAVLGRNVTLYKGVTVGSVVTGPRQGVPVIGNHVYIGINSTVVGGITIWDDVMIAPNTFINFDVPSHSVVLGSPGKIYRKSEATKGYILNPAEEGSNYVRDLRNTDES